MKVSSFENNQNALRLSNLDKDNFVKTLTELMQPFSLSTNNARVFFSTLKYFQLPAIKLIRITINQSILVKTVPQFCGYKLDIPIKGKFSCYSDSLSILPCKSAFLAEPGERLDLKLSNNQNEVDILCPIFDPEIFCDHTTKLIGGQNNINDLELPKTFSLLTPEGKGFLRTLTFLYREIEQENPALQSPIVAGQFQDATMSMCLYAMYPKIFGPTNSSHKACKPKYIKLAESYIRANVAEPLSVADIALAVGVSSSSLFQGFKKSLNTTPMAYLKEIRLEYARSLLLENETSSTTVSDIAFKCGFSNLGNFAADYRQAFGELPSETLRG